MDFLVELFANNVALSFIIMGLIFFGLPFGGRSLFRRAITSLALGAIAVLVRLSLLGSASSKWEHTKCAWRKTTEPVLCKVVGMGSVCNLAEIAEAPAAAGKRKRACLESAIEENKQYGSAKARRLCEARENDADDWGECLMEKFHDFEGSGALQECFITHPSQFHPFKRDLIRTFACPFGCGSEC